MADAKNTTAAKPAATASTTADKSKTPEPKVVTGSLPTNFTLPPKPKAGGGASAKYPFDSLEPGGAFGVQNKTRRQLASAVNNANKKYRNEAKDVDGKVVSKTQGREFYAVDVDDATAKALKGSPLEGSTVLVVRKV